jgi:hypothetical protein
MMVDNLTFQLNKLMILQKIKDNLKSAPILIGDDALNLVDLYISDLEYIIGEITLEEYIQ